MEEVFLQTLLILDSTVRLATPLILAAMAGIFCERVGIIDIGLEGKMLGGAFVAGAVAALLGNPWIALLCAMMFSMALSMVHAVASVTFNGNQVISGMALNITVAGLGPTLAQAWFSQGGRTPILESEARFRDITFPFAEEIGQIPVIGPIYEVLLSGHNILVYLSFIAVALTAYVLYETRFGLRIRAAGENPAAVETAGIAVQRLRYQSLMVTGLLTGMAGTYLAIAHSASFIRDMSAGRGYLALAAMIFGKWKPVPTMMACFLFAFADAIQVRLQGKELPYIGEIPVQAIQSLPYILTVLLLAGFVGKAVAPKALGMPYIKER